MENILTMCDMHIPYHDVSAVNAAFKFAKYINPEIVVIGEWLDMYQISKFVKDPNRINDLQSDIDLCVEYLRKLRKILPNARIIDVKSNHHIRLVKFIQTRAPALYNLRDIKLEKLLKFKELGIEHKDAFEYKGIVWLHGDTVRKYAGYTARAELEKNGMSVVSQHTHRLANYYERKRGGKLMAIESGCLCDVNPDYISGTANWMQGVSLVTFRDKKSKHYYGSAIPIIDGTLIYGNKIFKGEK